MRKEGKHAVDYPAKKLLYDRKRTLVRKEPLEHHRGKLNHPLGLDIVQLGHTPWGAELVLISC